MQHRKIRLSAVLAVSSLTAAFTAAMLVTDYTHNGFWADHPITAALCSGLIILAVGYLLINVYLERIAVQRWTAVREIAFKRLGKSADELHLGLQQLLCGEAAVRGFRAFDGATEQKIEDFIAKHSTALGRLPCSDQASRLRVLIADSAWCLFAIEVLDFLKQQHRQSIADWASVLLTTSELARVLNGVAELNEKVFVLQDCMRQLRQRHYDAALGHDPTVGNEERDASDELEHSPGSEDTVIDSWRMLAEETVFLQEELMRAAVGPNWRHRRGLDDLGTWKTSFDGRHRPGTIVRPPRRVRRTAPRMRPAG